MADGNRDWKRGEEEDEDDQEIDETVSASKHTVRVSRYAILIVL